ELAPQTGDVLVDGLQALLNEIIHIPVLRQTEDDYEPRTRVKLAGLKVAQNLFAFQGDGQFRNVAPRKPGKSPGHRQRSYLSLSESLQLFHQRRRLVGDRLPHGALAGALHIGIKGCRRPRRERARWRRHGTLSLRGQRRPSW